MKTKPFDLKAALAGAPVVTKDGHKVINVGVNPYVVRATVVEDKGTVDTTFTATGIYSLLCEDGYDLLMLDEEGGEE